MAEAYIGEIRVIAFNWAPEGWLLCQGQTLQTAQYQALYSLIGNVYGGDGNTTFKLPDLRGRVPVHPGQGPLGGYIWGQLGGTTSTVVHAAAAAQITSINQLPAHTHEATFTGTGGGAAVPPTITLKVSNDAATSPTPVAEGYLAGVKASGLGNPPNAYVGTATSGTTSLNTGAAVATGGSGGITGGSVAVGMTGATQPAPIPVQVNVSVPPMMAPFIAMNYIICVNGYYPSRP